MLIPRALPVLCVIAGLSGTAFANETALPTSANVAQLLQTLQDRLNRLEARNAELERRLKEPESASARLTEVITEVKAAPSNPNPIPDLLAKLDGISVAASLLTVAQQAKGGAVSATELSTRADVEIELPGGSIGQAEGKIFAHFRAGDGEGVDGAAMPPGTFATANATVFGNQASPVLMQAWYQLAIPVGSVSATRGSQSRVELTAGKIDPFGFFDGNNIADDESEGFMNLAFVHNPLLDAGGDIGVGTHGASPGTRVAYVSNISGINGANTITTSLGVFAASNSINAGADYLDSFSKPLTIAQVEYAGTTWPGLEGAYRLYAWNNARAEDQINSGEEKHAGWGLSLDQQIASHATLFARYGHSTEGNLNFDRAFTLGGKLAGGVWGRENDRIGLAVGALKTSAEYRNAASGGVAKSGSEKIYELFYAWQANDHLQITPSLQFIDNPAGTGADDLTVWGLRAKLTY